ncbi:MAG TPA: histidine kinase, partial [Gaiellaceae bacterium]|nr:histidine kinase [Gaiellaceae bacterium]
AELERSIELLHASDAERRRLVSRLVLAQEEERRLIATDLHDDAVQAMTAVGLRLGLLRSGAEAGNPPAPEDFEKLESNVRAALRRLRRLLFELRPAELDRSGLAATLAVQLAQQKEEFGLDFRLESRLETEPSVEARVVAYRLAREALANARVHARASEIVVELESRDDGVYAAIRDDGAGFEVDRVLADPRPSHLGLPAMRERAELAGGWLRITSSPGAGTTVEFWIPDAHRDSEASA